MWTPCNKGVKCDIKPQLTIWNIVFFLWHVMLFISAQLLKTIILQYNINKKHIVGTITVVTYAETISSTVSRHRRARQSPRAPPAEGAPI